MDDLDLSLEPVEPGEDDWDDGGLEALADELDEPWEIAEPKQEAAGAEDVSEPDSDDPLGELIASIDAAIAADVPDEAVEIAPRAEAIRRGHLVFSLSGQRFAAPIDRVVRLDRVGRITPTPNTPAFVLGVTNVHGSIVPTLNLRHLLGMPNTERSPRARLVQLKSGNQDLVAGVVVDALHGIRTFDRGQARDEALHILDVDGLFGSAEIRDLMNEGKPRSG